MPDELFEEFKAVAAQPSLYMQAIDRERFAQSLRAEADARIAVAKAEQEELKLARARAGAGATTTKSTTPSAPRSDRATTPSTTAPVAGARPTPKPGSPPSPRPASTYTSGYAAPVPYAVPTPVAPAARAAPEPRPTAASIWKSMTAAQQADHFDFATFQWSLDRAGRRLEALADHPTTADGVQQLLTWAGVARESPASMATEAPRIAARLRERWPDLAHLVAAGTTCSIEELLLASALGIRG